MPYPTWPEAVYLLLSGEPLTRAQRFGIAVAMARALRRSEPVELPQPEPLPYPPDRPT